MKLLLIVFVYLIFYIGIIYWENILSWGFCNFIYFFLKDFSLLLMMEMYELCMFFKNYKEVKVKLLEF